METLIVPCTRHKIWDKRPDAGPTPARRAYTDGYFPDWCAHADASGQGWFVLSTHYGLVRPEQPIENYDVPVGEARRDPEYLARLGAQVEKVGLRPDDLVVLDWERFQELLAAALDVPSDRVRLRKLRF